MADEFENALKEATDQLAEMGYETAKNIEEKNGAEAVGDDFLADVV